MHKCHLIVFMYAGLNTLPVCDAVGYFWEDWAAYSSCSKKCGGGVQFRTRKCSKLDDATCPAIGYKDSRLCNSHACQKRDGHWSAWANLGSCNATCGWGFRKLQRSCSNPAPEYGGKECSGKNLTIERCQVARLCQTNVERETNEFTRRTDEKQQKVISNFFIFVLVTIVLTVGVCLVYRHLRKKDIRMLYLSDRDYDDIFERPLNYNPEKPRRSLDYYLSVLEERKNTQKNETSAPPIREHETGTRGSIAARFGISYDNIKRHAQNAWVKLSRPIQSRSHVINLSRLIRHRSTTSSHKHVHFRHTVCESKVDEEAVDGKLATDHRIGDEENGIKRTRSDGKEDEYYCAEDCLSYTPTSVDKLSMNKGDSVIEGDPMENVPSSCQASKSSEPSDFQGSGSDETTFDDESIFADVQPTMSNSSIGLLDSSTELVSNDDRPLAEYVNDSDSGSLVSE